jgi:hypothetical protein
MLLGDRQGFTIIGPATIVKEIKKEKAIVVMGNIISTISIENLEVVE